VDLLIPWRNSD